VPLKSNHSFASGEPCPAHRQLPCVVGPVIHWPSQLASLGSFWVSTTANSLHHESFLVEQDLHSLRAAKDKTCVPYIGIYKQVCVDMLNSLPINRILMVYVEINYLFKHAS
jgi:hypothetical protein